MVSTWTERVRYGAHVCPYFFMEWLCPVRSKLMCVFSWQTVYVLMWVVLCYWLTVTQWHHMATYTRVNIESGNGVLPDGIKSLTQPMLLKFGALRQSTKSNCKGVLKISIRKMRFKKTLALSFLHLSRENELSSLVALQLENDTTESVA